MIEFRYFKMGDFDCQETGENEMSEEYVHRLDDLREACGFPFYITSGYRSPEHSVEKSKPNGGGTHTQGIAADVRVRGGIQRMTVVKNAIALGFKGIGVAKTFVHIDDRVTAPVLWSY